jgi:hypothetical protein
MTRILLAFFLALGVASAPLACGGGSGNNPQPSGGLGY